jgi:hypothetical protein
MSKISKELNSRIAGAVIRTVARPDVKAEMSAASSITQAVSEEIEPEILHATNNEPWWQSGVIMGSLLVIATRLLAHFGYAIPPELHGDILNLIIAFGPYAGAAFVIGWRQLSKKPLFNGGKG